MLGPFALAPDLDPLVRAAGAAQSMDDLLFPDVVGDGSVHAGHQPTAPTLPG